MAVTTTIDKYAQYCTEGCPISGCLNGGEDYKSLKANTHNIQGGILAIRGWCGDNISNACQITKIQVTGDAKSGSSIYKCDCDFNIKIMVRDSSESGGVSGNIISSSLQTFSAGTFGKTADGSWSGFNYTSNISGDVRANSLFPAVNPVFWNGNRLMNTKYYIKNLKFTVTRTRACYITFKGDGVTESTTMYDYNTVPSYGSTPTRSGYTFKGWSNGSTTYSGTLPTAYEQDVTYTAVWEKNKVACTITYNGNGATGGSVAAQSGYVDEALTLAQNGFEKSYDVKLYTLENEYLGTPHSDATFQGWYTAASGGTKVGNGGDSYTPSGNVTLYAQWSAMPAVTLPTPTRDGYTFLGWYTAASGGIRVGGSGDSYTPTGPIKLYAQWEEIIVPPEIISAAITYSGTQVSATNKVPTGEGFLIAVGLNQ